MVKTSPSNAGSVGSIPGQGTKIPRASWPKNQNIKNRSNIVTNSIKTFKTVHIQKKKILKRKCDVFHTFFFNAFFLRAM